MTADHLRRIKAGDLSAFEEIFRELHAPLCDVVAGYVRSQDVAEEIVQDVFLAVWLKRATLATPSLRGYLFQAVRNRALQHLRHQAVVTRSAQLLHARPDVAGIAGALPLPDDTLCASESRQRVRRAMDLLPPRARQALVLRVDHELSDAEIAESMGISRKGVEKLVAIAKRHLRATLEVGIL
jgi:RNA polymerase sigma-70 factor (ECF subfamily)